MKKKKYIRPNVDIIVTHVEQLLAAATPAGGHGGGDNPNDTPEAPAAAKPVGSAGYQWFDEEESNSSSRHSLWD